jgi:hypothetical protein
MSASLTLGERQLWEPRPAEPAHDPVVEARQHALARDARARKEQIDGAGQMPDDRAPRGSGV